MKEGVHMEQSLLEKVKNQIEQIEKMDMKQKEIDKQLSNMHNNLADFYKNWKSNCKHVFYQKIFIVSPGSHIQTENYVCCLCGECSEKQQNFIGRVVRSVYNNPANEKHLPIPPERQAEVDSKNIQVAAIQKEISSLEDERKKLTEQMEVAKSELNAIAHLLNHYFNYPEVKVISPRHWDHDDFNYDPFCGY